MSLDKKDLEKQEEKFDVNKQDFWILVKAAYKAVLPLVFAVVIIYFLFTLFLTKFVLK